MAQGGTIFKVFYLGGQSNMDGYGHVRDLPSDLQESMTDVFIFHGNVGDDGARIDGRGLWAPLRPGHGVGFESDGQTNEYSDRFGIELSFAQRLKELLPTDKIALVKYSKGGTSIDTAASSSGTWDPNFDAGNGVNQYDHFLATLRNAWAGGDIDGDGLNDTLIPAGIVWMQGESDAQSQAVAIRYERHLTQLMELMRAAMRVDDLPVVIGRISDSGQDADGLVWDYGAEVRRAQEEFSRNDEKAVLVTATDEYGYSDRWHYDSSGYVDLGEKFAEAYIRILGGK